MTSYDKPSRSPSSGIVGTFGSTHVARRHFTTARIIYPEVESTRRVAMALQLSVGGKTWPFQSSRNLGKIREVKFLGFLE